MFMEWMWGRHSKCERCGLWIIWLWPVDRQPLEPLIGYQRDWLQPREAK